MDGLPEPVGNEKAGAKPGPQRADSRNVSEKTCGLCRVDGLGTSKLGTSH